MNVFADKKVLIAKIGQSYLHSNNGNVTLIMYMCQDQRELLYIE